MRQPIRGGIRLKHLKVSGRWPSGNPRLYYRSDPAIPLPDARQDSPEFLIAYAAAAKGEGPRKAKASHRTGTIGAAVRAYLASDHFMTRATSTRGVWRRYLEDIEAQYGKGRMADLQEKHIRIDLAPLSPHPANNRLKAWRSLCRWSLDAGLIERDPARDVRPRATPASGGHTPWTDEDLKKFRKHWPIASAQRLALEIMAHTGASIGDAIKLGPSNIKNGWATYKRQKTGTSASVPIQNTPEWMPESSLPQCIDAAPLALTYLCTRSGRPRSAKAARQWFAKAAKDAGLEQGKTAHGVRKWLAVTMAENGALPEQRMAILGHDTTKQTHEYSKTADAKRIILGTESDNFSKPVVKTSK